VRVVGAMQDITARREIEAELRRGNEVMHSVIGNLPCGLSVFDAELNLVAANAEFRRLLDFPPALFESSPVRFEDIIRFNAKRGEYGAGDVESAVRAIVDRARQPTAPHHFERVRPNGLPLEIRGAPMPGGGFVTTYTDVSERKRAEAEVQRAGTLLRGAIDAIDEAFVLFDADDRLVMCNQRHREIYPLTADLMVPGTSFEQLVRAGVERGQHAAGDARMEEWVAERLAIHRQASSKLIQRLADGRTLRIVERRMPDGHTVGFRVDITELVRATEAAQEASRAKGQFLANMSHEIRTPMNAILGMLALLRRTELSVRQADYAAKTEGAARSLLGLLNDILDFSKVEAGKMVLDPQPFRIETLLRELSVVLSANLGGKRVELLFDADPALPPRLVGDAMRLQQVLINLAGNAIKFTAEGEVVVSLSVQRREAACVTVQIAVRDSGIGIAPENQTRIFSGFTQAEASTTRRFGGTGLGVAISQRLVALMGGELRLESALGQGSRFFFSITLGVADEAADGAGAAGVQPADASLPAWRVLMVDDNPTALELLGRMGRSLGWQVDLADSGESALARLQARAAAGTTYEAVFVDWQMPGLDGWQTSGRIRALGLAGVAPVVVMVTAHGREQLARRSDADQALLDGFLVKPITASMLRDAVADARPGQDGTPQQHRGSPLVEQRLLGLRLLVAEDNLNNQQVARELLQSEGAVVCLVGDGQAAVDAVLAADPPFHVVLMDLQMPVMDGFGATRRIREDSRQRALPIVAMTANALASDRAACLDAGMNEHVGKPFDLDHLVRVLRQQAGLLPASDAAALPSQAAGTSPPLPLPASLREAAWRAGIDLESALNRLGGRQDVYHRLLGSFARDLAGLPARLQGLIASGDHTAASRQLHTLKGLAGTLGASALAAEAGTAEAQLNSDPAASLAAVAAGRVGDAIAAAGPRLAELLQALESTTGRSRVDSSPLGGLARSDRSGGALEAAAAGKESTASFDAAASKAALLALASQLQNADMAATDAFAELQQRFGPAVGQPLRALEDAIGALDFERALHACRLLIGRGFEASPT
jgi:signal transduction histidine kinase/CheY-like chemotaxis protein